MCTKRACHNIKYTNEISQTQRDISEGELTGEAQEFTMESGGGLALQEEMMQVCASVRNLCI